MQTDYAAIADRAVELLGEINPVRWEEVVSVMQAETITRDKQDARYTDLDILRDLGSETGDALLDKIEAAVKPRVSRMIQSVGLDLAHNETKSVLQQLLTAGAIDQTDYDALIGLTKETVPRFPGLRPGEIQNALQWREAGEI